jgi:hypothetical protein
MDEEIYLLQQTLAKRKLDLKNIEEKQNQINMIK